MTELATMPEGRAWQATKSTSRPTSTRSTIYAVLSQFHELVEIVLIIEPDSLPNLATNLDDPHLKECIFAVKIWNSSIRKV
jgi:cellulase/cellobiase CelA1